MKDQSLMITVTVLLEWSEGLGRSAHDRSPRSRAMLIGGMEGGREETLLPESKGRSLEFAR